MSSTDWKNRIKMYHLQKETAIFLFQSRSINIFSQSQIELSCCNDCSGISGDFLVLSESKRGTAADCCRHRCIWSGLHHYSGLGLKHVLLNRSVLSCSALGLCGLQSTRSTYGKGGEASGGMAGRLLDSAVRSK